MPAKIKIQGTKGTVKISGTITNILSSIRGKPDPAKGSKNPPHHHVRLPRTITSNTGGPANKRNNNG